MKYDTVLTFGDPQNRELIPEDPWSDRGQTNKFRVTWFTDSSTVFDGEEIP